jgi:hypothetical protein
VTIVSVIWIWVQKILERVGASKNFVDGLKTILVASYDTFSFLHHSMVYVFAQSTLAAIGVSLAKGVTKKEVLGVISLLIPRESPAELIRIGGKNDGGYLVPNDFEGIVGCFSPGVAERAEFDESIAEMGIPCFMVDFSVDQPPMANPLFDFEKLFLTTRDTPDQTIRLDTWIKEKAPEHGDLILQMDIEGGEWPVLADVSPETLSRFRIIVLEIHGLDSVFTSEVSSGLCRAIFEKLNDQFSVIHLHANNCCGSLSFRGLKIPRVLELTLIRKDRYEHSNSKIAPGIPNSLDAPNVYWKKELRLTKDWLG